MTLQKRLQRICELWQQILGLQDWDIEVLVVRHYDLDNDAQACINTFPETKTAKLKVREPQDGDPQAWPQTTPELNVIHELCHIHFEGLGDYSKDHLRILEEQAVHKFSVALWNLSQQATKRSKRGKR